MTVLGINLCCNCERHCLCGRVYYTTLSIVFSMTFNGSGHAYRIYIFWTGKFEFRLTSNISAADQGTLTKFCVVKEDHFQGTPKFSNFSDSADFAQRCEKMGDSYITCAHCILFVKIVCRWLFAISVPKSRYGSQTLPILQFSNFVQSLTRHFSATR